MKAGILETTMRGATWFVVALGVTAAAPAAAELIDTSDALLQKARPQAFGDLPVRKQLCARSGLDGDCRDGLPSVKQDLLQPPADPEDDLPSDPIVELPPIQDLLPPDPLDGVPLAIVPAAAAVSVPEPSAIGVLLLAAAGLAARRTRRRRR